MPAAAQARGSRRENRYRALQLLRQHAPLTRAAIGRALGLSPAAVSHLMHDLLVSGLVVEEDLPAGAHVAGRGRRPAVVKLNPAFVQAIGVEVTDVAAYGVLVDFAGQALARARQALPSPPSPPGVLAAIEAVVRALMTHPARGRRPLAGVGLGVHGLVDPERGVSNTFPPLETWRDVPLARLLSSRLGVPVLLDFRLYAATLAELLRGEGRQSACFVYVNAGEGATLGMGYVEGGRILRGHDGLVGQFGHLCVQPGGHRCFCGSRGCLITVASPRAIVQRALEEIRAGVETAMARAARQREAEGQGLCFADVVRAFHDRDKLAVDLMAEAAHYLGMGIAHVINLLNPAAVVLGGSLAEAGDEFVRMIDRTVARHTVPRAYQKAVLKTSRLGAEAAALGAAELVMERVVQGGGAWPMPGPGGPAVETGARAGQAGAL